MPVLLSGGCVRPTMPVPRKVAYHGETPSDSLTVRQDNDNDLEKSDHPYSNNELTLCSACV